MLYNVFTHPTTVAHNPHVHFSNPFIVSRSCQNSFVWYWLLVKCHTVKFSICQRSNARYLRTCVTCIHYRNPAKLSTTHESNTPSAAESLRRGSPPPVPAAAMYITPTTVSSKATPSRPGRKLDGRPAPDCASDWRGDPPPLRPRGSA